MKIRNLDTAIERLKKQFNPEKIILFGSHAWGNPNANSDVDLLVIVKSSDLPPTRRAVLAYRCLSGMNFSAEVIISTQKEIERYRSVPASLTRKILEKGRVLYG
ncbi:MAG: nucleotidyltransferase domain-containing protein [Chloroflexi bacterium]|nr:nucleotidyltransferase domain-containing protein [Chloroflexota bacterium]